MTWKIIKKYNRENSKLSTYPTLKVDGVEQSPEQAPEAFNNYFLNITENLNMHIAEDNNPI